MRNTSRRAIALGALALLAAGCGTINNFRGGTDFNGVPMRQDVFGGVKADFQAVTETPLGGVMLADMPLSLVADVATLPWTIKASRMKKAETNPVTLPLDFAPFPSPLINEEPPGFVPAAR